MWCDRQKLFISIYHALLPQREGWGEDERAGKRKDVRDEWWEMREMREVRGGSHVSSQVGTTVWLTLLKFDDLYLYFISL